MIFYEVGGSVRDSLMGRQPSDTDMTAVLEPGDLATGPSQQRPEALLDALVADLRLRDFNVIPERIDKAHLTVKAIAPSGFSFAGRLVKGPIDFVLARRDGPSSDGRHPDWVEPGSLSDDLARRDFTVNAVARDSMGTLIDEHGGVRDIGSRSIRCVGDPQTRFREDRLRILRALRFSVTHSMELDYNTAAAVLDAIFKGFPLRVVSEERVRDELMRMMAADTAKAIQVLSKHGLIEDLFGRRLWLKPTLEAR